jgi:hypothetical protein
MAEFSLLASILPFYPERQADGQPLGSVLLCATIAFREKNQ